MYCVGVSEQPPSYPVEQNSSYVKEIGIMKTRSDELS